jgi:hypothetical protein
VAALTSAHGKETLTVEGITDADASLLCARFPLAVRQGSETLTLSGVAMPEVMAFLLERGISVRRLERQSASLEALFMEVTAE